MNQTIYLDHAATTEMLPLVVARMEPYLEENYANASTSYEAGRRNRQAIEEAREQIAECIQARPQEIYFTSGGSEADNWAIKSIAGARKEKGNKILTTPIEHHAVLNSCAFLQKLGYDIGFLPVDSYGRVELEGVEETLTEQTTLMTVMYGNNEIGTIEPIRQLGNLAAKHGIAFHTDAVQAVGQIPISVRTLPVDALSASAHKFHGPKGIGFLYAREELFLPSFIHGGAQERGKRAGTENVAGIVGMACALEVATYEMRRNQRRVQLLRDYMIGRIQKEIPQSRLNGHPIYRLPGNVNISIAHVEATALLVMLEEQGILASAGSACTTGQARISHVIQAIQVPQDFAPGTLRFSLGARNTKEEIDTTIRVLAESVRLLQQPHPVYSPT